MWSPGDPWGDATAGREREVGKKGHLHPVNPPATVPENDLARGVALMHRLLARVPQEQSRADGDHIIRAIRRLGEIADAYEFAHVDIDGEVEDAIVSLLRWRLDREREAAR